ncbi:MAG: DUF3881 family protein [Lachnospiraceae bacterium]|nr:DUF3881 family protein [Lachnospiraceae bacterium]
MNCMLHTVGFSKVEGVEAERRLKDELIYGYSMKKTKTAKLTETRTAVEIFCEIAPNTGVIYRGEYDRMGIFLADNFFPAHISEKVSLFEPIMVSKRMDSDAYTAMAYDYTHKIPIIFYLQNMVDMYLELNPEDKEKSCEVYLTGLADDGKIILPVEGPKVEVNKTDDGRDVEENEDDEDDLESEVERQIRQLTEKEMNEFISMTNRSKDEDLYSIVETTFMPCGTEVDTYTIIGKILSVESRENYHTNEEMYIMDVECNGVVIEICINKTKLMGEPEVGRRFKGNIWLQGYVNWKTEKKDD